MTSPPIRTVAGPLRVTLAGECELVSKGVGETGYLDEPARGAWYAAGELAG